LADVAEDATFREILPSVGRWLATAVPNTLKAHLLEWRNAPLYRAGKALRVLSAIWPLALYLVVSKRGALQKQLACLLLFGLLMGSILDPGR
jgi:hypothetical protein